MEDLQLAVESYQKKINLTRPDTTRPDLRKITPYTGYPNVQGIIYQDELSRNRLMRTDELHKFSDGTLNHVRTTLNDIATGIQMDYFPKRRWSPQDMRRARVMISAIDRKLRDRRLMHNLEKFVGGRPIVMEYPKRPAMFLNLWRYKVVRHRNSRVNSFTMKMEILLKPTSNKLMVEHVEFDESNANVLERFYTSAGNPIKEILLKLNLTDHRICKDSGEVIMEYLVNISKRRTLWSLNADILKINDSDYQYAVSIKEDTAYPCLHSPKTTKEQDQYTVSKED
ncbi:hypothetical protein Tco_0331445 [Tanacetum coccineum]